MRSPLPIDYATRDTLDARLVASHRIGRAACIVGGIATILPMLCLAEMLIVPARSNIRPMGQAVALLLGAITGLCVVLPLSLASLWCSWRHRVVTRTALVSVLIAIAAIGLDVALFLAIVKLRRLTLAP